MDAKGWTPVPRGLQAEGRIHLTATGYAAGAVFCGCDKAHERVNGATFVHAAYCPDEMLADPRMCSECRAMWQEILDEPGVVS